MAAHTGNDIDVNLMRDQLHDSGICSISSRILPKASDQFRILPNMCDV